MAENKVKLHRSGGFTILQNDLIRDQRLSLKTKGLFAVIASLPPNWEYSIAGLSSVAGVGRDAIRGALAEMEEAGYLERRQNHDAGGKFAGCTYVIYEESDKPPDDAAGCPPLSGFPTPVLPSSVLPLTENPTQLNKDLSKERLSNTPYSPPPGDVSGLDTPTLPKWEPERFAGFWAYYPRKVKRDRAVRAWDKLKPSHSLIDAMGRALRMQVQFWSATNTERQYIPHPATWLNSRAWEDDPAEYSLPPVDAPAGGWAEDPEVL